jgi:hypothetical protein
MPDNLTFTFAGDEAGDASKNFEKGASRYFVVAVVATRDADGLRSVLADLRHSENLVQNYEFHFNSLTSARLREKTMTAIHNADFTAWALIVDKTSMPYALRDLDGMEFYLHCVVELINRIPVEYRRKGTMILDEVGSANIALFKLKRTLKNHNVKHEFSRIFFCRSRSEDLIQAADLVAGAILRRDAKNDSEAFELIEDKLQFIFEYRP